MISFILLLASLNFVDTPIADVVRSVSLAYDTPILVDGNLDTRVTFHLDGVGVLEGLTALCEANGLELVQSGEVFHVRRAQVRGVHEFSRQDSLVSISVRQKGIADFIREFGNNTGLNVLLMEGLDGLVDGDLRGVTAEEALRLLMKSNGFRVVRDGAAFRVEKAGPEKGEIADSTNLEPVVLTCLYPLKHVHTDRALGYLSKLLPSSGLVAVEVKEQNGLLLSGTGDEIRLAGELLSLVDVPALQVTLSCMIVEFKRGKNFEMGLHSGAARKTGEKDVGLRGFLDFSEAHLSKSGAFGKVGLLPDRFELELAALEENNSAEVLARPRLTTINGNKAELNVTNTVYYLVSQVSADGYPITDYRSFNDGISLEITPTVTRDGSITLEVSPEIKTAGRSTGDGPRDISTRNLKTVVVLKDGETFCLGGLIRKNKSEVRSAVPFLGSLPLVGRFFSYVSEEDEENELAIFITPKVEGRLP